MWGTWCTSYLHPPLRAPRLTLGPRNALGTPTNVRRGGDFAKFYPPTRVKMEFPLSSSHAARPYGSYKRTGSWWEHRVGRPSEGLFYGRPRGWREAAAARRWLLPLIYGAAGWPAVRAAQGTVFHISAYSGIAAQVTYSA